MRYWPPGCWCSSIEYEQWRDADVVLYRPYPRIESALGAVAGVKTSDALNRISVPGQLW